MTGSYILITGVPDTHEARRDQARQRKQRERARRKQASAIEFVRTDASLFLHPDRLSQKAGAPKRHLRRMALKELVDNALDAAATAILTEVDQDTFIIQDDGPGIAPAKVVALFSVTRPMMSTKLIRRPTRGMVGNGLRVATGAAFSSGGNITVESRGVRQELTSDRFTGETIVAATSKQQFEPGTRVTIHFGPALPRDQYATLWGNIAVRLAGAAAKPMLTHPDWYSNGAFAELIEATRGTAQELAALFDITLCHAAGGPLEQGQSGDGKRDIDPDGPATSLSLDVLKSLAGKQPKLVPIPEDAFSGSYRAEKMEAEVGGAVVPALVQVWAKEYSSGKGEQYTPQLIVNRTPAVADLVVQIGGSAYFRGCGMDWTSIGVVSKGSYIINVAVTAPAIALISDGKTPDLAPFKDALAGALGSALRSAHRPVTRGLSIKDAAFKIMAEAYDKASAGGTLPANARQIMYAARPHILEWTGRSTLNDAYFTQTLLPTFIEENPETVADWDVVYDARGHLVEPHTNHSLPLGTLQVRDYLQRRPRHSTSLLSTAGGLHQTVGPGDRYGAVLFIEKEGFEPLLRAARIAERFDIAIMSTKGMSVIAARSLIDRISASGLKILVAHDLDLSGIRIFGTLGTDSSRYQFANTPDIRRLGVTLDQANDLGLQSERQDVKGDHERLLVGLRDHGASEAEIAFITGGRRVELNAMPSDQFVEWIEAGLRLHDVQKVIPPTETIERRARQIIGMRHLRQDAADLELAAQRYAATIDLPPDLEARMRQEFERDAAMPWEDALAHALDKGEVA
ncbi:ATP-binding protein [Mesorhizobium sp. PAMC28654]|uniref:ATP-binding protein n=1 Tax=Mesorhizobium sp. PAMC28654 TaxID=2880934 RepID=UPI001D0BCD11|nr:ATP-binding protein [Mesorhizobium sp. PAMC28654]UDL87044.1 ATP-binding protein [Mesorhizobium sp. PAMC28654]